MLVKCPSCDVKLKIEDDARDTKIECPKCDEAFTPSKLAAAASVKSVAGLKKPVKRTDDEDDGDDEDDRPTPKKKKKKGSKQEAKKFPTLPVAIGGGLALITIVGLIIFLMSGDGEGKVAKNNNNNQVVQTPSSQAPTPTTKPVETPPTTSAAPPTTRPAPPTTRPAPPVTRPTPPPVDPYADLFKQKLDVAVPTIKAAKLTPEDEAITLDVPTFHSLRVAQKLPTMRVPKEAKLTRDDVKKAAVFIKVSAGELSSSGSGFYIGVAANNATNALIATNYHVIEAAAGRQVGNGPERTIDVVFNSGEPEEKTLRVKSIVATDPIADLAILRVDASEYRLPKPISPWATPALTEEMDVRIFGFPFGSALAVEGVKNPSINIGPATISSLPKNKAGRLEEIRLNGSLNPGNSGGPIVDKEGRLVGIAVATIKGSGVGFAIPADRLIALVEGKLLLSLFVPVGLEGADAKFKAILPIMDPLDNIDTVYVRWWAGKGTPPKAVKDLKMGYKPIVSKDAREAQLQVFGTNTSLAFALGDFHLPQTAETVLMQIASQNRDNVRAASAPVAYKFNIADIMTASDTKPLSDLTGNPESQAGQVMVLRGRIIDPPAKSRRLSQELKIVGLNGESPMNIRFLTSKVVGPQFDEVARDHQGLPVRLTCLVGKRDSDGFTAVRVDRVDFISNEYGNIEHIVHSIPSETTNPVFLLNRDPSKYLDQSMEVSTSAILMPDVKGKTSVKDAEIIVLFPGLLRPRNLAFMVGPDMLKKILEEDVRLTIYKVKLTIKVAATAGTANTPTKVDVKKIQILDTEGKLLKTIE